MDNNIVGRYWTKKNLKSLIKKTIEEMDIGKSNLEGLALLMPTFAGPRSQVLGGALLQKTYLRYVGNKTIGLVTQPTYRIEFKTEANARPQNPQKMILGNYGTGIPAALLFTRADDPTKQFNVEGHTLQFNKLEVQVEDVGVCNIINGSGLSWWPLYEFPAEMWGSKSYTWISQEFHLNMNYLFGLVKNIDAN